MSACTHKIDLKSLVAEETDARRTSPRELPSKIVEKPRQKNDAWCIVATDGSTKTIGCKSTSDLPESKEPHEPADQVSPKPAANENEDEPDALEAGVDLAYLDVEKETAAKLIAGMQAMIGDLPAAALRREIAMPSAMTDLQEIFRTDDVCIVSPPKTQTKGLSQAPGDREQRKANSKTKK